MGSDVSFASFNLYNLQLAGEPTRRNAPRFSGEEYGRRLAWCAGIIREMQADVIAFQELWSADALRNLFERAGLSDEYELHFIGDDWYDIAVAAAVRRPWRATATHNHKNFPDHFRLLKRRHGQAGADEDREDDDIDVKIDIFSRTVLQLTIEHEGGETPPVEIFCAHLKSKLPTRLDDPEAGIDELRPHREALGSALSTIRRTAEAAALRMIMTEVMKGTDRAAALLGDLNDDGHSNTLAILTEQPRFRRFRRSRIGSSSDNGLYTAGFLQALSDFRDVAYTHIHDDVRSQLDHVLVSEQFYDHSRNRRWSFRDQRIWNDHIDADEPNGPERQTTDHGIVRARFLWDPAD